MRLFKSGRSSTRDFAEKPKTMPPSKHEDFLIRQSAVLADEYLHGDRSDSEQLQPWDGDCIVPGCAPPWRHYQDG